MVQLEKFGRRNVVLISSNSPQSIPIFGNNYLKQFAVGALSGKGGASRLKAYAWDECDAWDNDFKKLSSAKRSRYPLLFLHHSLALCTYALNLSFSSVEHNKLISSKEESQASPASHPSHFAIY